MNNKDRLYLIKSAQQFQNKYDPNNQASMREAYMNRGAGSQNMSYTPEASSIQGNFGFSNAQDFNKAKALSAKGDPGGYGAATNMGNYQSAPANIRDGALNMRQGLGNMQKFTGNFTAPETQTRYNSNQPGGSNYYHGLHHINTDEFGDHTFSSAPRRTDANFRGEGGQEKFDQALKAHKAGVGNYNDYGSFQAPDNPPDLLAQRLQESGGNLGSTDYLTQRLNEQGMNNSPVNTGAMLATQVSPTPSGNNTASVDPSRQAILDQAKSRGLQLSPDGKSWVPMQ
jgi:hypothetical protein